MAACDALALTLFCFPCAGASATNYLRWRRQVPAWLRIEPVEPPGRGSRLNEALLRDYGAAVDDLSTILLRRVQGRYALFGHSMGALLAYGCALRLARTGAPPPSALAVAAAAAPTQRPPRANRQRPDTELIDDLRRLDGAPKELFEDQAVLRATLDTLAADYDVCDSFAMTRERQLSIPIFVYGGTADSIGGEQLSAWRRESSEASTVTMFEGGHFFLRERETLFLRQLANDLSAASPSE